ncbi:hypothetical protein LMG24235_06847 [Paraburkholderia sabiae]|nr:hypothetical protein LMG24235_06847 [Paraburkholderia sabiae]
MFLHIYRGTTKSAGLQKSSFRDKQSLRHGVDERGCNDVLQLITNRRGAMNGLLAVVLEDHIRTHLVDAEHEHAHDEWSATEQLIEVVHSYFNRTHSVR